MSLALRFARSLFGLLALSLCAPARVGANEKPFAIRVEDDATGRGVPLVELRTVNEISHWTDSNGFVAFHEPGLMDQDVFFHVRSHGYEYPKDGFGYRGKALRTIPGGKAVLKIRRINLAERLCRLTGAGIYRDTLLLGEPVAAREPALNAQVLGSDSVVNAVYRGKLFWFWGDTNRARYPLGNFHVPGATSELPADGRFDPAQGVDFTYFIGPDGFAKPTAKMPGDGPTWLESVFTLGSGPTERMFAGYAKVKPPLTISERGLAEWDDARHEFRPLAVFPKDAPAPLAGHPFAHVTEGVERFWFCSPCPLVRTRAILDDIRDASCHEAFTCLKAGGRLEAPEFDRDESGRLRYSWKRGTPPVGPEDQQKLVRAGRLRRDETLLRLADRDTGRPVTAHRGSVCFNEFRKRWVMIAVQTYGTSLLGEVWYAEADTPLGPWGPAVKVVTHDRYSFYNPKQHPLFDRDGGRVIHFEGTYTHTFSGNTNPTPRYDYNQILYRLDLADPRLSLPVPFALSDDGAPRRLTAKDISAEGDLWAGLAFFALDRPGVGTIPLFVADRTTGRLRAESPPGNTPTAPDSKPLFHAMPVATSSTGPPAPGMSRKALTPLWEFHDSPRNRFAYATDPNWQRPGFMRAASPLCQVWRVPGTFDPGE